MIRTKGLSATSVDDLCAAAGVTKGAFFHHFESKQALAVAAADHWSQTTGALFAAADYHDASPIRLDRILGYLDLRAGLIAGSPADYTCLVGTMTQEAFATNPEVRDACAASIFGHARTLEADFAAALAAAGNPAGRRRRRARASHPGRAAGRVRAQQGGRRSDARRPRASTTSAATSSSCSGPATGAADHEDGSIMSTHSTSSSRRRCRRAPPRAAGPTS